jgi:hypothetical protein
MNGSHHWVTNPGFSGIWMNRSGSIFHCWRRGHDREEIGYERLVERAQRRREGGRTERIFGVVSPMNLMNAKDGFLRPQTRAYDPSRVLCGGAVRGSNQ